MASKGRSAVKPRKPKAKKGSPQLERLKTRVRNLESKLSESVPKRDLEAMKGRLEGQVSTLRARLEGSVPKSEADSLRAHVGELEGLLAESVPRPQLEEASRKVDELETLKRALEAGKLELDSKVGELKSRIQDLELSESSQLREIVALKERAAAADLRAKETIERIELLTKKARYRKEDGGHSMQSEDWRELRSLVAPHSVEDSREHKFGVKGTCVGCGITELEFEQGLSILQGWPEDSEKNERIAELKTCSNELLKTKEREFASPAKTRG